MEALIHIARLSSKTPTIMARYSGATMANSTAVAPRQHARNDRRRPRTVALPPMPIPVSLGAALARARQIHRRPQQQQGVGIVGGDRHVILHRVAVDAGVG